MNIAMYLMTHKQFKCPKVEGYIPIQVGALKKERLGYLDDSVDENISSKNQNYCELTGVYWLWKNINDVDVVGISHYRRFFSKSEIIKSSKLFLNIKQVEKILKNYDIILPKKEIYRETVYEQYCRNSGFAADLDKVEKIIKDQCPEYLKDYKKIMKSNKLHQFNMIVCSKNLYNEYCKWLFEILFKLEETVDLSKYNDYQKRIYGFLSERLLNVWVEHNNLRIKEMKVVNIESNLKETLKIKARRIKNSYIFCMRRRKINERNDNRRIKKNTNSNA